MVPQTGFAFNYGVCTTVHATDQVGLELAIGSWCDVSLEDGFAFKYGLVQHRYQPSITADQASALPY